MEVYLEDRVVVVNVASITKIQALWRGVMTRSQMSQIKTAFNEIHLELEGRTSAMTPDIIPIYPKRIKVKPNVEPAEDVTSSHEAAPEEEPVKESRDDGMLGDETAPQMNVEEPSPHSDQHVINNTTVWDSATECNPTDLEAERKQVVLELLWVQQAINSRKQYLKLRQDIS